MLASGAEDLAPRFFREASRLIEIPWSIAAGNDLRYAEGGARRDKPKAIRAYLRALHRAASRDVAVARAFAQVLAPRKGPASQESVERFAQDNDVPFSNYASLTRAEAVRELIAGEIDRVNRQFARVEQIKAFRLIDRQLTPEDEELTPTMKLKRQFVHRKFAALIEDMYAGAR